MIYGAESGFRVRVGRVDRRELDVLTARDPPPEVPTRSTEDLGLEVFGGIEEEVPYPEDPHYQKELAEYYLRLGESQLDVIAEAIEIVGEWRGQLEELHALGLSSGDDKVDALRYVVLARPKDLTNVIKEVLYNSTVTERGVEEASRLFDVSWHGQPVLRYPVEGSPGTYSGLFEARLAARHAHLAWDEFCELAGPEQSAVVAFYRLRTRLDWLEANR